MVGLIISIWCESLKFDFPSNNVLMTEVSFCTKIFESMERILFIIYAIKNEVNGRLDTIAITTQRVYRIWEIVVQFVLFQMPKTNSKGCKKFSSSVIRQKRESQSGCCKKQSKPNFPKNQYSYSQILTEIPFLRNLNKRP